MAYRELTKKEEKWIDEFEKIMAKAPKTLLLFVGPSISIYAKDENNQRYMTEHGSMDQNAPGEEIKTDMDFDGGDY